MPPKLRAYALVVGGRLSLSVVEKVAAWDSPGVTDCRAGSTSPNRYEFQRLKETCRMRM